MILNMSWPIEQHDCKYSLTTLARLKCKAIKAANTEG